MQTLKLASLGPRGTGIWGCESGASVGAGWARRDACQRRRLVPLTHKRWAPSWHPQYGVWWEVGPSQGRGGLCFLGDLGPLGKGPRAPCEYGSVQLGGPNVTDLKEPFLPAQDFCGCAVSSASPAHGRLSVWPAETQGSDSGTFHCGMACWPLHLLG